MVHTGDWKLDNTPYLGSLTSEETFRGLGDEGVLALICDSTNVVREGTSPSEADVARRLRGTHQGCAASGGDHHIRVECRADPLGGGGRARMRARSRDGRPRHGPGGPTSRGECGYLDDIPEFRTPDTYGYLPRDKVVALLTGSQGEPRAALARIAQDEHPESRRRKATA